MQLADWIVCFIYFPQYRSRRVHISSNYAACSFFIAPTLLVFISLYTGAFSFNQCDEYLLYVLFEYCLHSFITQNNLWTHYLTWTNNQVRFNASTHSLKKLMQQKCLNNKSRCSLPSDFIKCECTFVFNLVGQWSVLRDPPKADPFKFP